MTGIFLILLAVLWLVAAFLLAKLATTRLPKLWWAHVLRMSLFLALLPLPLVDEIVGKRQFDKLCSENTMIQVDPEKAVGRTVYLADLPDIEIKGPWVRVVSKPWRFIDTITGETVVAYNTLQAAGGLFTRTLGIFEGGVPLTFKGSCAPADPPGSAKAFAKLGITYVEPPTVKLEQ